MPKRLTVGETDNLFLGVWDENFPESYEYLWYKGIETEQMISDCVEFYPKLYKKLLYMMEKEAERRGLILP